RRHTRFSRDWSSDVCSSDLSMPCTVAAMPLEQSSVMNVPLSHYALRSWNTRDGLPHNSINRISQGPDGYLWLATWEGPVRYNGQIGRASCRERGRRLGVGGR